YIDNVVQMNILALTTNNKNAINEVYNTAVGERTTLNELFDYLREFLSSYDSKIGKIEPVYGPNRPGDIPHSLASIAKAEKLLGYNPTHDIKDGLQQALKWYWENI